MSKTIIAIIIIVVVVGVGYWIYHSTLIPEDEVASAEELSQCVEDGDALSAVVEEHLNSCCEGLKEQFPIPDMRVSVGDVCYENGPLSESNVGICIKCGDGICKDHWRYSENPCNCPEDCNGENKSHLSNTEEPCQSTSISGVCEETVKDFPMCKLCAS